MEKSKSAEEIIKELRIETVASEFMAMVYPDVRKGTIQYNELYNAYIIGSMVMMKTMMALFSLDLDTAAEVISHLQKELDDYEKIIAGSEPGANIQ